MPVVDCTTMYTGLNRLIDQGAGMAVSALHTTMHHCQLRVSGFNSGIMSPQIVISRTIGACLLMYRSPVRLKSCQQPPA